jgi:hypothetical protein
MRLFRRDPRDPEQEAHERAFDEAAQPILADLRAAGFKPARNGDDLVDLAHQKLPSPEVADVLRGWLPRTQNMAVKGTVARALAEKSAGPETAEIALAEYRAIAPEGTEARITKADLALCIEKTAARSLGDAIADVVADPAHGTTRGSLLELLVKWRHPRAAELALAMLDDPDEDLVGQGIWALGQLKAQSARGRLEQMASTGWKEPVRHALDKLDRAREGRDPELTAALDTVADELADESKLPAELMPALREALPELGDDARISRGREAVLELLGRGELELRYGRPLEDEFEVLPKRRWRSTLANDDEWLDDRSQAGGDYFTIARPGSV